MLRLGTTLNAGSCADAVAVLRRGPGLADALLLVRCHSNRDVADRLGISTRTVEDQRAAIMAKTGAAGLAGLMALADPAS